MHTDRKMHGLNCACVRSYQHLQTQAYTHSYKAFWRIHRMHVMYAQAQAHIQTDWVHWSINIHTCMHICISMHIYTLTEMIKVNKDVTHMRDLDWSFVTNLRVKMHVCWCTSVPEKAESPQHREAEGGHQGEWHALLCLRVHEGESLSDDERQVGCYLLLLSQFCGVVLWCLVVSCKPALRWRSLR